MRSSCSRGLASAACLVGLFVTPACGSSPSSPTPAPSLVPALLTPGPLAVLDNGCLDFSDQTIWDFDWSDVPGATQYHLYVSAATAQVPSVDRQGITASQFQDADNSWTGTYTGWRWRVRAFVNGAWQDWSAERLFNVEPVDTDCGGKR